MYTCIVCGASDPTYSLPVTKDNGKWVVKPLCDKCRRGLLTEAKAEGKTLMIYGLSGSIGEAGKRNANIGKYKPILEAYAKAEAREIVGKNGNYRQKAMAKV